MEFAKKRRSNNNKNEVVKKLCVGSKLAKKRPSKNNKNEVAKKPRWAFAYFVVKKKKGDIAKEQIVGSTDCEPHLTSKPFVTKKLKEKKYYPKPNPRRDKKYFKMGYARGSPSHLLYYRKPTPFCDNLYHCEEKQDHSDLLNQPSEIVCKNALQEKEELAVNIDNDGATDMNP